MGTRTFTVDARLLQELGERLVGRPHIALGELIKNSFDADARNVEIVFENDSISIIDDGHGMSEQTFTGQWMRIGTTRKAKDQYSPGLGRPLTGSKGVGRLSAQLLAAQLRLRSTACKDPSRLLTSGELSDEIHAEIYWPQALQESELTSVSVQFDELSPQTTYAAGSPHGTSITLSGLTNDWAAEQFEDLAREIWALQPPFEDESLSDESFRISLTTPFEDVQASFDTQMTALMEIANAIIIGKLLPRDQQGPETAERFILSPRNVLIDEDGEVAMPSIPEDGNQAPTRSALISVQIVGYPRRDYVVDIQNCQLDDLDFEIRVFDLVNRQPRGIRVPVAREYLSAFGGVHLYDNGFRLPYYGPESDWLRLELDHARRLSRSSLLPESLHVKNAMQDLPSNKRVFGAANISTSHEQWAARENGRSQSQALAIQITRDRLTDNLAFTQLTRAVRLSLDLYALARASTKVRRVLEKASPVRESAAKAVSRASETVEAVRHDLPDETYETIRDSLETVARDVAIREREGRAYASLLGSLATAGMTSLAYEHEVSSQRGEVDEIVRQLRSVASAVTGANRVKLGELSTRLSKWSDRSDRIRALFRPLLDEESRDVAGRYSARSLIADVVETLEVIARGTQVDFSGIDDSVKLPLGTSTGWSAVFQNLLVNSYKATLEAKPGRVLIDSQSTKDKRWIRVQDNGIGGVDLETAEQYFLPFEQGTNRSEKAEILGMTGSGLGLAIVRMITAEMRCTAKFVEPEAGWSTAIVVEWEEG